MRCATKRTLGSFRTVVLVSMSGRTVLVAVNALLLKRLRLAAAEAPAAPAPFAAVAH